MGSPVLRVRVKGWFFGCWGVWLVPDISSAAWSTTTTAPGTLSRQAPHRPLAGSCPEALPEPTSPLYGACQSEIAANGSDDSTQMYSRPHQSRVHQRAGLCDDCQDLNEIDKMALWCAIRCKSGQAPIQNSNSMIDYALVMGTHHGNRVRCPRHRKFPASAALLRIPYPVDSNLHIPPKIDSNQH